ncbi:glycosyltransferase family 4 protein [Acidithiobacillus ferrivorans]|uniref:glycosyltransferase family 4 protein n=1 Tax=Acidithiobacillus ferrivorans TaxID=160808 RepID=UPI0011477045|nr:glycosyltransferase family 4 protein [Acidithiobacillus ferrivorans]
MPIRCRGDWRGSGIGLPPIEAMATGCPVLVADVMAMPEACGDAGGGLALTHWWLPG